MTFESIITAIGTLIIVPLLVHAGKKYLDRDKSVEQIKSILKRKLANKNYTDRSFDALKKSVGTYPDEELRKILLEIGSERAMRNDKEYWYLSRRKGERIEKLEARRIL